MSNVDSTRRVAVDMIVLGVLLALPAGWLIANRDFHNGFGVASIAFGFGALGTAVLERMAQR